MNHHENFKKCDDLNWFLKPAVTCCDSILSACSWLRLELIISSLWFFNLNSNDLFSDFKSSICSLAPLKSLVRRSIWLLSPEVFFNFGFYIFLNWRFFFFKFFNFFTIIFIFFHYVHAYCALNWRSPDVIWGHLRSNRIISYLDSLWSFNSWFWVPSLEISSWSSPFDFFRASLPTWRASSVWLVAWSVKVIFSVASSSPSRNFEFCSLTEANWVWTKSTSTWRFFKFVSINSTVSVFSFNSAWRASISHLNYW